MRKTTVYCNCTDLQSYINIMIIFVFTSTHVIYNYIRETNPVYMVQSVAAVLYLQSLLHVILFRSCNMFCTFTSALSSACVQCPTWLVSVIPQYRAFPVGCAVTVWVILRWFQSPCNYQYHFCFHIPHALNLYCKVFIFQNHLNLFLHHILSALIATSIDMYLPCLL